jgi:flagellar basal-body rod protein FlgG
MNDAFYVGATGLHVQQAALDVVSNNISNINTSGFKRAAVQFSELVAAPQPSVGNSAARTAQPGSPTFLGVTLSSTPRIFTQGQLQTSQNPLDIAIQGDGFLQVLGANGQSMLWRGGTLQVNADGYLAATDGLPLKPLISVPRDASALTISQSGQVTAQVGNLANPEVLGQLELTIVNQPDQLEATSDGLYQIPDSLTQITTVQPGEDNAGTISQGFTESSNVDLTNEMVNLLIMQRAYAANAKVVQAGDELMSIVNGLKR